MFDSLFKLTKNVVDVVAAPITVAAELTRVVTEPLANAANVVAEEVKEVVDEITDP